MCKMINSLVEVIVLKRFRPKQLVKSAQIPVKVLHGNLFGKFFALEHVLGFYFPESLKRGFVIFCGQIAFSGHPE